MEIAKPKSEFITCDQAIAELELLLQVIRTPLEQPCPSCVHPEKAGNPDLCNSSCPDAPQALSSEPEKHPIEPHVVSVTFELNKLRLFQPCWSCEGHLDEHGVIQRLPQINFYCANPVYALMLNEHIELLHYGGHLHSSWQITLGSMGQKLGVMYVLKPSPEEFPPALKDLQEDLLVIGNNLAMHLRIISETRLSSLTKESSTKYVDHCQRL